MQLGNDGKTLTEEENHKNMLCAFFCIYHRNMGDTKVICQV